MAFNIAHQLGSLTAAPISDAAGGQTTADPAPALWKPPMAQANLGCRISRAGNADLDGVSPPLSPCRSPASALTPIRQDLNVACQALVADPAPAVETDEVVHDAVRSHSRKGVPVYVMLPLDTVKPSGGLNRKKAMNASLMALKNAGVEGVMVDVWWGIVEREGPGEYDWGGYSDLMLMARRHGLKVQAVMSFHQCGGNVGDSCTIPLPKWVLEEMEKDPDLAYTDQWGRRNYEYVSLGCDSLPVLKGRSPVQCYSDFMRAFRDQFKDFLGSTIVEIQVGMGPAGELRYPSYPELNGTWKFPGIGAFQCYDKYMLSSLKAAAEAAGKPEWGHSGPTDAGTYNNWPEDAPFFRREGGGWNCPYGDFFLTWYSQMLLNHGELILSAATTIFSSTGAVISIKVAGIHWHYGTRSHAPELTAGYYNTRFNNGYLPIARMLARHGAIFNFTCVEMKDWEQPAEAMCRPEALVKQVAEAARESGVGLAGENALPRYDEAAHEQILKTALKNDGDDEGLKMVGFTYLRMGMDLFHPENWRKFAAFVQRMADGCAEETAKKADRAVHETRPLVQEALMMSK